MSPVPRPDAGLALTGERTLPDVAEENYWYQRHVVAYDLVAEAARDAVVLDAGCGEGYGLARLAHAGAWRVIGVDYDRRVVDHVRRRYAADDERIEVHAAELLTIPLGDDAVDLTISFQVIEHLYDIPGYLASLRRVTRPGGAVVLATPNRLTFSPGLDEPENPFHTREFTAAELEDELQAAGLEVTRMAGVGHGRLLRLADRVAGGSLPRRLGAGPAPDWPGWLRALVPRVGPGWFTVRDDDLDSSLDLIAWSRNPA